MSIKIFISCVSGEFRAYRDQLRTDLTRHNVEVKVQEDFKDYGVVTLDKLDIYIRACDAVIHLVGDMTGAAAKPASTQAILAKYPDIAERLPPLREPLYRGEDISYTQWEAWLALYHGKLLLIAKAGDGAPRDPESAPPTAASRAEQQLHLDRLRALGRYPGCRFVTPDELAKYVLASPVLDMLAQSGPAAPDQCVEFGVSFPSAVVPANSFIVDAWMFKRDDRQEALERATKKSGVDFVSSGAGLIAQGTKVSVTLRIPTCKVRPRTQSIVWDGNITNVGFIVTSPNDLPDGNLIGTCNFSVNGLCIGCTSFEMATKGTQVGRQVVRALQFRNAFASYASKDRRRVLARVQGIEKLSVKVFVDVRDLRANDPYPSRLLKQIDASDVLYLFWSRHASHSQWVEREWRYGVEKKGIDFIDPVPLVDPRKAPPPPELAETKHFGDWTLAYLEYEKSLSLWRRFQAWVADD